jgi:hypothetical protein
MAFWHTWIVGYVGKKADTVLDDAMLNDDGVAFVSHNTANDLHAIIPARCIPLKVSAIAVALLQHRVSQT